MKIAIPTANQKKIFPHFGRTPGVLILTVEDNKIVKRDYRPNDFTGHGTGHHHDAEHGLGYGQGYGQGRGLGHHHDAEHGLGYGQGYGQGRGLGHDHDAAHGLGYGQGYGQGRGLGYGQNHGGDHYGIFNAIGDCDVVITGGMGRRLYDDFVSRNMEVFVTDEHDIERAVELYLSQKLDNKEDKCCDH
jgi:predicted Fe-Mo cluster-binding NifX family protein